MVSENNIEKIFNVILCDFKKSCTNIYEYNIHIYLDLLFFQRLMEVGDMKYLKTLVYLSMPPEF